MNQEKKVSQLSTIDGKSLLALECEPPKFIISRILPTGLSVLAGSPKVGKSWFSLWLSDRVAKGEPVWDFDTLKSTVLYLALEDTVDRLHFRLSHITAESSEQSHFATTADSICGDLIGQLERFVADNPNTGLIIIDTLQRIRGNTDESKIGYAFDYEAMNTIKALADRLKIAILLVHHTRKTPDSDPFNTISGSTGLTGSADTMFVLEKSKRTENKGILHVTGRDVEDMQINLEFDKEKKVWQFVSFDEDCGENPADKIIETLDILLTERKTFSGTATELIAELKRVDNTVEISPNILSRMLKTNLSTLENRHGITQEFKKSNGVRVITLCKTETRGDDDDFCETGATVRRASPDGRLPDEPAIPDRDDNPAFTPSQNQSSTDPAKEDYE